MSLVESKPMRRCKDRRYLKRGTQIRFLGNVWVNKQTKPLSEISDEEIDELHRRKCMIDRAGGEDEIWLLPDILTLMMYRSI